MDVADLSHERATRSMTTPRSASTRERRAHRPGTAGRPSQSLPAVEQTGGALDPAAPDTADQLQADYFIRMLAQRRRLIDQRIGEYQRAIANAEAKGDADAVCGFRRLTSAELQDRRMLDGMIDKLCRRFTHRSAVRPAVPGLG
jgi:hypothetical protein